MSSDLFQSYDLNLRRQFMTELIDIQSKQAKPPILSIFGVLQARYSPSEAARAGATAATIPINVPATVCRMLARPTRLRLVPKTAPPQPQPEAEDLQQPPVQKIRRAGRRPGLW
ncbi:MAG: hypothetical protein RL291_1738 [Pseudomonadota bacterium]